RARARDPRDLPRGRRPRAVAPGERPAATDSLGRGKRRDVCRHDVASTTPGGAMIVFLVVFGIGAGLLPVLARFTHRWVFLWAALLPPAAFAHAVASVPALADGEVRTENVPWVPELGLELAFRMDALSGIMALLVAGVGALVFLYCFRYFAADDRGTPRFVGVLMAFAGSMYGLVL